MVHPINNYIHVTGDLELGDTIAELNRRRAIYLKSRSLTVQFTAVIYLLFNRKLLRVYNAERHELKQIWVIITLFGIIQLLNIAYVVNFYRVLPFRQIDTRVINKIN